MNVRKFIAANARDALRKVKETLGNDAIILSNRGVPGGVKSWLSCSDMAMIVPTPVADSAPAQRAAAQMDADDDYRVVLNSARARISQPVPPAPVPPAPQVSAR
jgi:flagellar biosynthesis protein FlhF